MSCVQEDLQLCDDSYNEHITTLPSEDNEHDFLFPILNNRKVLAVNCLKIRFYHQLMKGNGFYRLIY